MVGTHVDDLLYAYVDEMTDLMNHILAQIVLGKDAIHDFRFCGREFSQDPVTFEITVTCEKTTTKMEPIRLAPERTKQADKDDTVGDFSTPICRWI